MYYYGGRETSDCEFGQYRPIVYHHKRKETLTGYALIVEFEDVTYYLGDPLPDLETATEAAYDWANDRGLSPLELE